MPSGGNRFDVAAYCKTVFVLKLPKSDPEAQPFAATLIYRNHRSALATTRDTLIYWCFDSM